MVMYLVEDLENLTPEEIYSLLSTTDIITSLRVDGYMRFSSFTRLPYTLVGRGLKQKTKIILGGVRTKDIDNIKDIKFRVTKLLNPYHILVTKIHEMEQNNNQ
jgi:hypothetical protein